MVKGKSLVKVISLLFCLNIALATLVWAGETDEHINESQLVDIGIDYGLDLQFPIEITSESPLVLVKLENGKLTVIDTLYHSKHVVLQPVEGKICEVIVENERVKLYDFDAGDFTIMTQGMVDYMNTFTLENFQKHLSKGEMAPYVVKYNGKNYRGGLILKPLNDLSYGVINKIYFEDYILGVLPKEMSKDWPIEALKAQAVAARNFGMISKGKHDDLGFDLCSTSNCQVYGGFDVEGPISNQAVFETYGENLYYGDKLVSTFYHSSSGGFTAGSEYVWQNPLPYLRPTPDPYSQDAPNAHWQITFKKGEIEEILNGAGYEIGQLNSIELKKDSVSGRVVDMVFKGSKNDVHLEKQKARTVFGYNTLKSMLFTIGDAVSYKILNESGTMSSLSDQQYVISGSNKTSALDVSDLMIYNGSAYSHPHETNDSYTISGSGWGHGLGLSQYGAKKMAELGYDYKEILSFYYNDTVVK